MSRLHIIFDPTQRIECAIDGEFAKKEGICTASLYVADDLSDTDIYEIARKLAALLLEQL